MLRCWAWFGCKSCVVRLDCRGELDAGRLLAISMGETVLGMATICGSCGKAALKSGSVSSSSSSGNSKSSDVNSSARVLV